MSCKCKPCAAVAFTLLLLQLLGRRGPAAKCVANAAFITDRPQSRVSLSSRRLECYSSRVSRRRRQQNKAKNATCVDSWVTRETTRRCVLCTSFSAFRRSTLRNNFTRRDAPLLRARQRDGRRRLVSVTYRQKFS